MIPDLVLTPGDSVRLLNLPSDLKLSFEYEAFTDGFLIHLHLGDLSFWIPSHDLMDCFFKDIDYLNQSK